MRYFILYLLLVGVYSYTKGDLNGLQLLGAAGFFGLLLAIHEMRQSTKSNEPT